MLQFHLGQSVHSQLVVVLARNGWRGHMLLHSTHFMHALADIATSRIPSVCCPCCCCCPCCRIHPEPLFDLLFTQEALFTSCGAGQIRCWLRPAVWAASQAAAEQQGYGRR
jgi:hypothetical protein